jgi:DNA-binding SARP family transcriptional activator
VSQLVVELFGGLRIRHEPQRAEIRLAGVSRSLTAYLVVNRHRSHARDALTGLLWPDAPDERGRARLSTALWRLRALLEPPGVARGTFLATTADGRVGFAAGSDVSLDTAEFEARVAGALRLPDDTTELESAVALYRADALDGLFDDWALRERARLLALHVAALDELMRRYERRGDTEHAIVSGRRLLDLDPAREETHRALMRLYAANGQRTLALRQYADCRDSLETALGLTPLPETRALRAAIAVGTTPASVSLDRDVAVQLRRAIDTWSAATRELERTLTLVERRSLGDV